MEAEKTHQDGWLGCLEKEARRRLLEWKERGPARTGRKTEGDGRKTEGDGRKTEGDGRMCSEGRVYGTKISEMEQS